MAAYASWSSPVSVSFSTAVNARFWQSRGSLITFTGEPSRADVWLNLPRKNTAIANRTRANTLRNDQPSAAIFFCPVHAGKLEMRSLRVRRTHYYMPRIP